MNVLERINGIYENKHSLKTNILLKSNFNECARENKWDI